MFDRCSVDGIVDGVSGSRPPAGRARRRRRRGGARRARTEHTVDEDADRRLDPEIVVAVAEAADEEVCISRALQLVDAKRGHLRLEVVEVADLRTLDRLGVSTIGY